MQDRRLKERGGLAWIVRKRAAIAARLFFVPDGQMVYGVGGDLGQITFHLRRKGKP